MNPTLIKALVALLPMLILFVGSLILFLKQTALFQFLQLAGAACLLVVVVAHVCEGLHLFPWMHWGMERSIGHYLDLWCAILGLTLFPIGYLVLIVRSRQP